MRTWTAPELPELSEILKPAEAPKLFNTATGRIENLCVKDNLATLYVCGITPYDATHIGHAFTYLTYDMLQRAWLDAGVKVAYAQNITDVDDPLLERANSTGVNWQELAAEQIALFRSDMHRLNMLPPTHFTAVTEVIDDIAETVSRLEKQGIGYRVPTPDTDTDDIYFDISIAEEKSPWRLGDVADYEQSELLILSAARGGDPDRPGKRNQLDPLLWRAAREGEPSWDTVVGKGRPGWHIECAVIAQQALGTPFTVQGGGHDLIFPHHELSAASAAAVTNTPLAHLYSHTALVSYQGYKMSKSRGNLVFVSKLLNSGAEGSAIRLALLGHHYRTEWEWFERDLETAKQRLNNWRELLHRQTAEPVESTTVVAQLRAALANDLDTPLMLAIVDGAVAVGVDNPELLAKAIQRLLGVSL